MKDAEYFARRSEQEAVLAQKAKTAAAVAAHFQLSIGYLARAQPSESLRANAPYDQAPRAVQDTMLSPREANWRLSC